MRLGTPDWLEPETSIERLRAVLDKSPEANPFPITRRCLLKFPDDARSDPSSLCVCVNDELSNMDVVRSVFDDAIAYRPIPDENDLVRRWVPVSGEERVLLCVVPFAELPFDDLAIRRVMRSFCEREVVVDRRPA